MNKYSTKIRTEMKSNLDQLRALRDEVRLKAHLAKMETKQRWVELEPRVNAAVEEAEKGTAEASREVVSDAIHALEKLRDAI